MKSFRSGYHKCLEMPEEEYIEKGSNAWHIHKDYIKPSMHRRNLDNAVCPYCRRKLKTFSQMDDDLEIENDFDFRIN